MTAPIKFLQGVMGIAFIIGLADGFGNLTYRMAKAAIHAHQFEQVSWGKFSRQLWNGGHKLGEDSKVKRQHP